MRKGGREERKRAKRGGIKKKRSGGELGAAKDTKKKNPSINLGFRDFVQFWIQILLPTPNTNHNKRFGWDLET